MARGKAPRASKAARANVRLGSAGAESRPPSWLSAIHANEFLRVARDRNFMVRTLTLPIFICGAQILFNPAIPLSVDEGHSGALQESDRHQRPGSGRGFFRARRAHSPRQHETRRLVSGHRRVSADGSRLCGRVGSLVCRRRSRSPPASPGIHLPRRDLHWLARPLPCRYRRAHERRHLLPRPTRRRQRSRPSYSV